MIPAGYCALLMKLYLEYQQSRPTGRLYKLVPFNWQTSRRTSLLCIPVGCTADRLVGSARVDWLVVSAKNCCRTDGT
jgi:hypothetical protein